MAPYDGTLRSPPGRVPGLQLYPVGPSRFGTVVLRSLRTAAVGLARNPVLFVPAAVVALLQVPQFAARALGPLATSLASVSFSVLLVVVMPFVQGGLFATAKETLDGRPRLATFVGVLGVAVVLAYLAFAVPIQFYGQAIVLDGASAMDGFRRSVALVRRNPLATLGYSAITFAVGLVFGGFAAVVSILLSPRQAALLSLPSLSAGVAALLTGLVLVVTTHVSAFLGVHGGLLPGRRRITVDS